MLAAPMLTGGDLLGVILIYHLEVRPVTGEQIALVETFADQSAIAIENVRLLSELRDGLQQQTATADAGDWVRLLNPLEPAPSLRGPGLAPP